MTIHKLEVPQVPRTEIKTWIESPAGTPSSSGIGDKHVIALRSKYHKRVTLNVTSLIDVGLCSRVYTSTTRGSIGGSPGAWEPTVLCDVGVGSDSCSAEISDSSVTDVHIILRGTIGVGSALVPLPSYPLQDTRLSWR